jgi:hypothetical protein
MDDAMVTAVSEICKRVAQKPGLFIFLTDGTSIWADDDLEGFL